MYKNLRAFRESLNMTQKEFALSLGFGLSTYNGYETGAREPKSDFWITVAQKYDVTIDYLMGYSNDPSKISDTKTAPPLSDEAIQIARDYSKLDKPGQRAVKVILRDQQDRMSEAAVIPFPNKHHLPKSIQPVSAGRGAYLGPEEMETIDVIENDLTLRASFCVPVSGDSMEPLYHDGDILLVEGREEIATGQIGVFTVDGEGYVKKMGKGELISLNPDYPPVPMVENNTWCNGLVIGVLEPGWVVE